MGETMRKVIGLFPTPFMMSEGLLDAATVDGLRRRALSRHQEDNAGTNLLSHTEMVDPGDEALFADVVQRVAPEIDKYGELLFGDRLDWTVKEMWMNVLEPGGSQFMHSHANSFVSGIVYLSDPHPSTRTVFMRNAGGNDFVFKHDAADEAVNPFKADRWIVPPVKPGDLVLYPSYLLHGVPPNQGERRFSLALNAIPDRLKSFDYEIRFLR